MDECAYCVYSACTCVCVNLRVCVICVRMTVACMRALCYILPFVGDPQQTGKSTTADGEIKFFFSHFHVPRSPWNPAIVLVVLVLVVVQ